ncbi:MAG: chloride channel protein [Planctomycetota bacterium]|jgi:CIC family chloride channel protein
MRFTDIARRLRLLGAKLGFERDWYLILVAGGIGLVMGTVAIAFILPLRWLEEHGGDLPREFLLWLVPTMPVLGALLAGTVMHLIGGPSTGPGVAAVMYNIHRNRSQVPLRVGARKWLASTLTIGSGGSAGAEGPIVTIGSVIGSNIARLLRVTPQNRATLLGCGAAAGLSAVFNAPIAGVFFVMEILLRDFSLRTFTPIVVASVVGAVTAHAALPDEPIFGVSETFKELTGQFTLLQIPNYIVLGLLCGFVAAVFIRSLFFTERIIGRIRVHPILRPAIGATMLGTLGLGTILLLSPDSGLPAFYGNGYPMIERVLDPALYIDETTHALRPAAQMLTILVMLGVLKGLATCLTIGSGGAGGLFAPSLMMGAAVGGSLGYIVNVLEWFPAASPATYAVVGMAAMVAATTHAPLTGIIMVYEITQSYEIILPLMLTAVISTILGRLIYPESVYTVKLTALGVRLGAMSDLTILRRLVVQDVPLVDAIVVQAGDSAQRLLELSEQYQVADFIVVDEAGHYQGLVTGTDLKAALVYREAIPLLQVNELVRSDVPTVGPVESLDLVLDKFARYDVQSLAVLAEQGEGSVIGLITRERLMREYQDELNRD